MNIQIRCLKSNGNLFRCGLNGPSINDVDLMVRARGRGLTLFHMLQWRGYPQAQGPIFDMRENAKL